MEIIIKKKGWWKRTFYSQIVDVDQNILFTSEIKNLEELEHIITHVQRYLSKATLVYDFDVNKYSLKELETNN
jgi:hypothetical protein